MKYPGWCKNIPKIHNIIATIIYVYEIAMKTKPLSPCMYSVYIFIEMDI